MDILLPEEVLLLAIDPKHSHLPAIKMVKPVISAAVLFELACQNRIVAEGRAGFLLKNSTPSGNPFMDNCMNQLRAKITSSYLKNWVTDDETGFQDLIPALLEQAKNRGIIKILNRTIAFIFTKEVMEDAMPELRNDLTARILAAVNPPTKQVDARTYCLVKALQGCPHVFNHVIPVGDWPNLQEPVEDLGSVDGDLIQHIFGHLAAQFRALKKTP